MNGSAGEGPGAPPGKSGGGEDTLKDVFGYLRNTLFFFYKNKVYKNAYT